MTRRQMLLTSACGFAIAALATSFASRSALAIGPDQEQAELANALSGVKVSLQQGLTASEREGQPISGKFEVDNGKLQLSVYTAKEGNFFEVIVDHVDRRYLQGRANYGRRRPRPRQGAEGCHGQGQDQAGGCRDQGQGTGEGRGNGRARCKCSPRAEGRPSGGSGCSAARKEILYRV